MDAESVRSAAYGTVALCVIGIVIAVAKPGVAHLIAQAVLIAALFLVGVIAAASVFAGLPKGPFATGWRPARRVRPALPREITALIADLDQRGQRLPPTAVAKLTNLMINRLELRYHLSPDREHDLPSLQRMLSPLAFALVTARRSSSNGRVHPFERVDRRDFDPLMNELEHL